MTNSVPSWGYAAMIVGLIVFIGLIVLYVRRNHGFKRPLFASPYVIWIIIFTVVPCLIVAYYSFTHTVDRKADDSEQIQVIKEYTITVKPATVTVTAENKCMQAGAEMPELTVIVDGYSFGSKQGISKIVKKYLPRCETGDVPGEYEITFDCDTVYEEDYEIRFISGTMQVTAEDEPVLCVNDYCKKYDSQELKTTATCSDPGAIVEYSTDLGETWQEKPPSITDAGSVHVLVRATKDGIQIAEDEYTLTVTPAEATVVALNQASVAGTSFDSFLGVCLGLTYSKKDEGIVFTLDANPGTKPGEYEITAISDADQGNYHITCQNGTLTLTESGDVFIAVTDLEQVYNGKKIVPTEYAFLNQAGQKLVQKVQKLDEKTGEFVEISAQNIEHVGVYRIVNAAVKDTVKITEFTFDNFMAFWDSNYIARENVKSTMEDGGAHYSGSLSERGKVNFDIFVFSLWMAFLCTVICLLLGYPAAHIMADREFRLGSAIVILFVVPMWMNFLLRTIAMMALLNDDGVINSLLKWLGMQPASLINNAGAVLLGMVYNFLPFMVFPIYNVLNKMDIKLSEAAMDLGCNKFQTFYKVTLPLSVPGIVSGITMVFMPAVTTFYISGLLGGGKVTMFGDLIESKFISTSLTSWNEGSALSLIMMILILISIGLLRKADPKGEGGGAI
ncbi:MAG: hypothetical protein CW338_04550 [Clostridiales bacterium]|nr:hypothetical protein [Clostridiales bacterium]